MARKSKSSSRPAQLSKAGLAPVVETSAEAPDYVIVELRYEAPVAARAKGFTASDTGRPMADELNAVLGKFDISAVRSHFSLPAATLKERIDIAETLPAEPSAKGLARRGIGAEFIESGFVQIVPRVSGDAAKIARSLNNQEAVWKAYVAPRPVPAMPSGSASGSRNFEPAQGYLYSAPDGIGATEVWPLAGAKGKGVTICDIEGNWNRTHEDLPKGIPLLGGTPINDLGWRNHGTAVLGEMVSIPSSNGCVGISHEANAAVQSAMIGGVFNTAGAISNVAANLKAGDVILIELQAVGPNQKYVAMQYWPDIFAAIQVAVAKGICVVEAAGNGDENFDLKVFKGTGLQKDSGAIIVGAGVPPANHVDFDGFGGGIPPYSSLGTPRSRIFFSNYGKIVNVQGWGWHVTTLGYGDAQGGASENTWYTLRFSGTSSASPIVTGAVACIQGRAKAKNGAPLTPKKVRDILVSTGTKQVAGPGVPVNQHIGPLPNLAMAMKKV